MTTHALSRDGGVIIDVKGPGTPGEIRMWPTDTPPEGWFVCNGQALSKTLWPDLYALVGYAYGGGGDTYNVPDFSARSPQGASATDALRAQVGVKMQTQVPYHRHSYTKRTFGGAYDFRSPSDSTAGNSYTQNTGTAGGVDQRGPRLVINFIVKA